VLVQVDFHCLLLTVRAPFLGSVRLAGATSQDGHRWNCDENERVAPGVRWWVAAAKGAREGAPQRARTGRMSQEMASVVGMISFLLRTCGK